MQKADSITSLPFKGGGPLAVEGFYKFAIRNSQFAIIAPKKLIYSVGQGLAPAVPIRNS